MSSIPNLVGMVVLSFSLNVHAALFDVVFHHDQGSQWAGVVDSSTDSLTLTSWTEGAGFFNWWTPTDPASVVFHAVDGAYASYDVQDSWDGTIGFGWGFLSDLGKDVITWNEGVFAGNSSRIGWGIGEDNGGGIAPFFNEFYFLYVPTSSTGNQSQYLLFDPDNSYVTVVKRGAIPVPSPLVLIGLGIAAIGWTWSRQRIRAGGGSGLAF